MNTGEQANVFPSASMPVEIVRPVAGHRIITIPMQEFLSECFYREVRRLALWL